MVGVRYDLVTGRVMGKSVFVSYAREDEAAVQSIHEDLSTVGHDVFYDGELQGGDKWWSALLERIKTCDVFLPVLSEHWNASRPCRLEVRYGAELGKPILPVRLEPVEIAHLPESVAQTQWVEYGPSDKTAALRLAGRVSELNARPLPTPLPDPPAMPIRYLGHLITRITDEAELSRADQESLLNDLRRASDDEGTQGVLKSVELFLDRDDLYAAVARDLTKLQEALSPEVDVVLEPEPEPVREPDPAPPPIPDPSPARDSEESEADSIRVAWSLAYAVSPKFVPFTYAPSRPRAAWAAADWIERGWYVIWRDGGSMYDRVAGSGAHAEVISVLTADGLRNDQLDDAMGGLAELTIAECTRDLRRAHIPMPGRGSSTWGRAGRGTGFLAFVFVRQSPQQETIDLLHQYATMQWVCRYGHRLGTAVADAPCPHCRHGVPPVVTETGRAVTSIIPLAVDLRAGRVHAPGGSFTPDRDVLTVLEAATARVGGRT